MNMYLSRVMLDEKRRTTMIALANPSMFHVAICCAFEGPRPSVLWRIDSLSGKRYLLILSVDKPDLITIINQFGTGDEAEIKNYDKLLESIEKGKKYQFFFKGNPTYYRSQKGKKRGRVCAHATIEYQKKWLVEQGSKNGFEVNDIMFDIKESHWYTFRKRGSRTVSILSICYEGVLKVTNEDLFRSSLINGIGRGKAYGVGLMTIMRYQG